MRLLHGLSRTHASFDDPNLVSHAGLVPVMALAQRSGLGDLVAEHVRPGGGCGVNANLKVACLVAAGPGPECAGRGHQHANRGTGDRRYATASGAEWAQRLAANWPSSRVWRAEPTCRTARTLFSGPARVAGR